MLPKEFPGPGLYIRFTLLLIYPPKYSNSLLLMAPVPLASAPLLRDPILQKTWTPKPLSDASKGTSFAFDSIEDALTAFAAGDFIVVMDDKDRENEGDLIISASHCTTEKMAWMIKHTRYAIDFPVNDVS